MQITVHGTSTALQGKELMIGGEAPAARITRLDGTKNVIGMIAPTVQLLIAIPSLKTEVCSLGAKRFDELLKPYKKLTAKMITTDDIDAAKEYVEREGIESAEIVIDTERDFARKYGLLITEGKLKDRLARAVYVIDRHGLLTYKELVTEVVDEVDYDACIAAVEQLVNEKKTGHTHENWMSV